MANALLECPDCRVEVMLDICAVRSRPPSQSEAQAVTCCPRCRTIRHYHIADHALLKETVNAAVAVARLFRGYKPPLSYGPAPTSEADSGTAPTSEADSGPAPTSEADSGTAPTSEADSGTAGPDNH